ncbi:MAG: hypothetical protein N3D84_01620, partial [Candidatus Woesearchaeota archaeon]|nr:hypothetical protein [Candidatus Woesearchaeota archaeon]
MSSGYSKYGKLKHSFIHNPFLFFLIILTILAFVFFLYGCRSKTEAIKDTYFPSAKSISAPQENKTEEEGEFYTFSDLPGILEGIGFIVGNKAPAEDIVTVSEIKAALFNKNIET